VRPILLVTVHFNNGVKAWEVQRHAVDGSRIGKVEQYGAKASAVKQAYKYVRRGTLPNIEVLSQRDSYGFEIIKDRLVREAVEDRRQRLRDLEWDVDNAVTEIQTQVKWLEQLQDKKRVLSLDGEI